MDDSHSLSDLGFFVAVVQHGGFSAAARATGIEKTRLSRRVTQLEQRLGVRLLQRSTRRLALTEAGERFHEHARVVVETAEAALDSVAQLRKEPAGHVRLSCSIAMAQGALAAILPGYLAANPKVSVVVEATDRQVDLIEERIDLALRARVQIEESAGLVARELGRARRILVASPAYIAAHAPLHGPEQLAAHDTIGRPEEAQGRSSAWKLHDASGATVVVSHTPRLVASNRQMQLEAAVRGIGVTLLPETIAAPAVQAGYLAQVLRGWEAPTHVVHLVYPRPRGMLPSVRSLIDYLVTHYPAAMSTLGR